MVDPIPLSNSALQRGSERLVAAELKGIYPLQEMLCYGCQAAGEVSEWLKEHAWKACVRVTVPRVRIPPSPPRTYVVDITALFSIPAPDLSLIFRRLLALWQWTSIERDASLRCGARFPCDRLSSPFQWSVFSTSKTVDAALYDLHPATELAGLGWTGGQAGLNPSRFRWVSHLNGIQSAPLTEARGDTTTSFPATTASLFQSAPLTEARGDRRNAAGDGWEDVFQSAPLTEARGDDSIRRDGRTDSRFNPLPLPKQGEMRGRRCGAAA